MKLLLKQNNAVYKFFGIYKIFFVFSIVSIITGVIYIVFINNIDVISMSTIICFGSCAIAVSLINKTQYSKFNIIGTLPIKSEKAIHFLFSMCEKLVISFYSIIVLMSMIKFDIKIILLNLILCSISINFGYLISDGTDPQKQEVKISMLLLIIFSCGMAGGIISVICHKIIESDSNFMMIGIMSLVLIAFVTLAIINRHFSYKKFKNNIFQMTMK